MVDIIDVFKSLDISFVTVMKNPEILKFVPDQLRYVSDQYNTEQMCDKTILENGEILKSVPYCYKN